MNFNSYISKNLYKIIYSNILLVIVIAKLYMNKIFLTNNMIFSEKRMIVPDNKFDSISSDELNFHIKIKIIIARVIN